MHVLHLRLGLSSVWSASMQLTDLLERLGSSARHEFETFGRPSLGKDSTNNRRCWIHRFIGIVGS